MSLRHGLLLVLSMSAQAFASNSDSGQRSAEEDVLPKLNLACGGKFTVKYDLPSLKANNQDIAWDQTSGSLECDEPLRLMWLLCQSEEGKAVVRRNELREVRCRGVKGEVGKLSVNKGVITVERAYEEKAPWARAQEEFAEALKVKVPVTSADPYYDQAWRDLRLAPAPVTSTVDYCLVDGAKVKLDLSLSDSVRDGTVKCFAAGVPVVDLRIKGGRKTGLSRLALRGDESYRVERFVDGRREGLSEQYDKKKLVGQEQFVGGERVWRKQLAENGSTKDYMRQYAKGQVTLRLSDDGKVTSLSCLPEARGDEVTDAWCGFKGERVVQIYDGTNKVAAVRTFRDGRMTREEPGDSVYSARRSVSFDSNGKKQGEERVSREDGTLESVTRWKAGEMDGDEELFSKDGKKVVTRVTWSGGVQKVRAEFFLNGNPKVRDTVDGNLKTRTTFFDLGAKESESQLKKCDRYGGWCENGTTRRWFEDGKLAEESGWLLGQQDGASKRWFANGQLADEARWEKGVLRTRRQWDDKGALLSDDEFEEDGSRKLKK